MEALSQYSICGDVAVCATLPSEMNLREVDRSWFARLIAKNHGSLRKLAAKMRISTGAEMDPGRLSRILAGKTEPSVGELLQLTELLSRDITEVVQRLGYRHPRSRKISAAPKEDAEPHGNWK